MEDELIFSITQAVHRLCLGRMVCDPLWKDDTPGLEKRARSTRLTLGQDPIKVKEQGPDAGRQPQLTRPRRGVHY